MNVLIAQLNLSQVNRSILFSWKMKFLFKKFFKYSRNWYLIANIDFEMLLRIWKN